MEISSQRLNVMRTAIELGVDETDFVFRSPVEREAWQELLTEFDDFECRDDLVWIAA